MKLTISGYSTALFSTWYFIEELGLLFDCGDGITSTLLQKSRKIEHAFISHADRDHLTGLLQFNQLNGRPGFPVIYYPEHSGSFPALEDFSKKFDVHVSGTVWKKLVNGEKTWIKKDIYVQALRNNHVPCAENINKSFGYKVVQVKQKLKQEYLNLNPLDIRKAIDELGKEVVYNEVENSLLCYSGDTPCENFEQWNNSQILIHEATFLNDEEAPAEQAHRNKHSKLEDVIKAVSGIKIESLILGHFSSRYSDEQIDKSIIDCCKKYNIQIPVYRILPGKAVKNILEGERLV